MKIFLETWTKTFLSWKYVDEMITLYPNASQGTLLVTTLKPQTNIMILKGYFELKWIWNGKPLKTLFYIHLKTFYYS